MSEGINDKWTSRLGHFYARSQEFLNQYKEEHPSYKKDRIQSVNLDCIEQELGNLKEALDGTEREAALSSGKRLSLCLGALNSVEYARLKTDIEGYEAVKERAFGVAAISAVAEGTIILGALLEALGAAIPSAVGIVGLGGSRIGGAIDRLLKPIDTITLSLYNFVSKLANTRIEGLAPLEKIGLVPTATLSGLNKLGLTLYGAAAVADVATHMTEGAQSEKAKLPLEGVLGEGARTFLGVYGNFGITYIIGERLFGFSNIPALVFTTGHIISEYIVQKESNGVSFLELDWSRTWGGNTAAQLTLGPMRYLWGGGPGWKGWGRLFPERETIFGARLQHPIPALRAIGGFIATSGVVNSAIFVPTGLFLERANLKNYWEGLTLREFTLAIPRKFIQAVARVDSVPSILAYIAIKPMENKLITERYSLFEGSGLYRSSMHTLLSKDTPPAAFIERCLEDIGSCNDLILCRERRLDDGDVRLLAEDIRRGEYSPQEVRRLTEIMARLRNAPLTSEQKKAYQRLKEALKEVIQIE
jgi:hypothetical protein